MKTITALEISSNLPMRVKSLDDRGMFRGETIRFYEVNKQGYLIGKVLGDTKRTMAVIDSMEKFELLH